MKVFTCQDNYNWILGKTFVVIVLFIVDIHVYMYIYTHLREPSVRFARSHLPLGGSSQVAAAL